MKDELILLSTLRRSCSEEKGRRCLAKEGEKTKSNPGKSGLMNC